MKFPRFSRLRLIFFFIILLGVEVVLVRGQCLEDQRQLLLQLKGALVFNSSVSTKLVRWDQSSNCSSWGGVIWKAGRVIALDLSGESISRGIENSSLFSLKHLQRLSLAGNALNSTGIPPGFENLTRLSYLNLSNAGFAGQIPIGISWMESLVTLDLSAASFTNGPSLKLENPNVERVVRNLTKLTALYLDGVNISATGQDWCYAISSHLPNLQVLSMSNCYISGPIEPSLLKLRYLSVIHLQQNTLSTSVPAFFANYTNLTSLRLSRCNLSGTFPPKIFQVPTLQILDLSDNELLNGYLPDLPQNGSLRALVLSFTNFSGTLPYSIGELKSLTRIELSNCNFSGKIPNSVQELSQLVYADFSSNKFNGSIPFFHMSKNLNHIDLSNNDLTGSIASTHWEVLQNLAYVNLAENSLHGSIPSSLLRLSSLQKILLSNNQFDGELVDFSGAISLVLDTLDLSGNKLLGPIPASVFELKKLNILKLSSNNFTGSIHIDEIGGLGNLATLDLSYNSLSINVSNSHSALSPFPQITLLKLASCNLAAFPDLRNQSRLVHLDLSDNQIRGIIPGWIWKIGKGSLYHLNLSCNLLVELQEPYHMPDLIAILDLHNNCLRGQIPTLPQFASYVDYSSNQFNSSIPNDIGNNLTLVFFFSLSSNNLTGTIPPSVCNATSLKVLDLSNNSLSGAIPLCLIELSANLGVLNLRRNKLWGTIPENFQANCQLQTLDLNGNLLQGQLPKSLANCTTLEVLNLGNNKIKDAFPCWLKNVSSLRVLILRANNFYGNIRCRGSHNSWPKLQIIDLASNNFSGALFPKWFLSWKAMIFYKDEVQSELNHLRFEILELNKLYYQDAVSVTVKGLEMELVKILTVFTSIDLSNNSFQGPIPETIGNLTSLYVLNLSHNALTEEIPASLGNLKQLESLDLSQNRLTGEIPIQLASLTFLSFLNLSYNRLMGAIPRSTQIQTFSRTSFVGNAGLCGPPLSTGCPDSTGLPPVPSPFGSKNAESGNEIDWNIISVELGYIVGIGSLIGPVMFWKRWRKWYFKHLNGVVYCILCWEGGRGNR
ncbi:receptor-like protein 7 [Malania oleifera]|uniref:receptor-like protein 7 n=1 Tax=Malania oleifera TaxID=397392 RepID=UPI0025AE41A9|nr:receptor-like protein 7 [Malania oleifera]